MAGQVRQRQPDALGMLCYVLVYGGCVSLYVHGMDDHQPAK